MFIKEELNPKSFNKVYMAKVKKDKFLKDSKHLGSDDELTKVWEVFNPKK